MRNSSRPPLCAAADLVTARPLVFKNAAATLGVVVVLTNMPSKRAGSPAPPKSAPAASKHADISPATVALYVPNLIGYFRLITGAAALFYAPFASNENKNMSYFLAFYFVSYMADALDGTAARALNQTSKFGQVPHWRPTAHLVGLISSSQQVLDMVTDRSCSAGLLCVLSHKFPQHSLLFVLLIALDMCSHYTSMSASPLRNFT